MGDTHGGDDRRPAVIRHCQCVLPHIYSRMSCALPGKVRDRARSPADADGAATATGMSRSRLDRKVRPISTSPGPKAQTAATGLACVGARLAAGAVLALHNRLPGRRGQLRSQLPDLLLRRSRPRPLRRERLHPSLTKLLVPTGGTVAAGIRLHRTVTRSSRRIGALDEPQPRRTPPTTRHQRSTSGHDRTRHEFSSIAEVPEAVAARAKRMWIRPCSDAPGPGAYRPSRAGSISRRRRPRMLRGLLRLRRAGRARSSRTSERTPHPVP